MQQITCHSSGIIEIQHELTTQDERLNSLQEETEIKNALFEKLQVEKSDLELQLKAFAKNDSKPGEQLKGSQRSIRVSTIIL